MFCQVCNQLLDSWNLTTEGFDIYGRLWLTLTCPECGAVYTETVYQNNFVIVEGEKDDADDA